MSWGQIDFNYSASKIFENENNNKNNGFLDCIRTGDIQKFFEYIENGADVSYVNTMEETPLSLSMSTNNIEIFELLIKFNANVNYKRDGYSLIWESLWENKTDFFQLLVPHIAKNTRETDTGKTILMEAIDYSNLEAVKSSVMAGININAKDNKGNTPLHYALNKENLSEDDKEIIKFLISAGADVYAQNANGNTPEDVMKADVKVDEPVVQQTQKQTQKKNYGNKKSYKPRKYTP